MGVQYVILYKTDSTKTLKHLPVGLCVWRQVVAHFAKRSQWRIVRYLVSTDEDNAGVASKCEYQGLDIPLYTLIQRSEDARVEESWRQHLAVTFLQNGVKYASIVNDQSCPLFSFLDLGLATGTLRVFCELELVSHSHCL